MRFWMMMAAAVIVGAGVGIAQESQPATEPTTMATTKAETRAATEAAVERVEPPNRGEYLTEAQLVQAYKAGQFALVAQETQRIQINKKVLAEKYNAFNVAVL